MASARSNRLRAAVAVALAVAFLLRVIPARADSISENAIGPWPTEKKIVVYALFGGSVVLFGYGAFALIKMKGAESSLRDDFPREKNDPHSADCRTDEECRSLQSTVDDRDAWSKRMFVGGMVGSGLMIAGLAAGMLWPNGTTKVAPSATRDGAGLVVEGRF